MAQHWPNFDTIFAQLKNNFGTTLLLCWYKIVTTLAENLHNIVIKLEWSYTSMYNLCACFNYPLTHYPFCSGGMDSMHVLGGWHKVPAFPTLIFKSNVKISLQTFRKFSFGSPKMISYVKDDPFHQVSSQKPSMSSKFFFQ